MIARAAALQALEDLGPVHVVQPAELDPELLVMPVGTAGSSAVMSERIGGTEEPVHLRDKIEELYGIRVGALMASEIGGANGCLAVAWAALLGLPLVDADGMGRAFPGMDQTVMQLRGIAATPAVACDERGRTLVIDHVTGRWLERLVRASLEAFGGQVATSEYIMRGDQVATATSLGSVTRAVELGTSLPAPLITGKVAEAANSILIEGLGPDLGRLARIEAESEFLAVIENGEPVAVVPDIIAMLDTHTGEVVQTEQVRYGLRVSVLSVPCDPIWHTPEGLRLAGPAAFGLTGLPAVPAQGSPTQSSPSAPAAPAGRAHSPGPSGSPCRTGTPTSPAPPTSPTGPTGSPRRSGSPLQSEREGAS